MAGRFGRYVKRTVLGLLALVVVAVATILIVVHTGWGRDKIRAQMETALQDAFPGGVKVRAVEGSVLGTLVIKDIEIDGMDGKPMVTVGKLSVKVGLVPLLSKHVKVESLVVDEVAILIRPQPPDPPKKSSGGGPDWVVELPDVRVNEVRVEVTGYGPPLHVDKIAIISHAVIHSAGPITAGVVVSGRWREQATNFTVNADAFVDGDRVTIPNISVFAAGAWLTGTKLAVDPAAPRGNLTLFVPAQTIARFVPDVAIPGDAMLTIHAVPDGKQLAVDVAGTLGDTDIALWARGDAAKHTASGMVIVAAPSLAPLTDGALTGAGNLAIALRTDGTSVRGVVIADERITALPPARAIIALDGKLAGASAFAVITGDGMRSTISGTIVRDGKTVKLLKGDAVVAVTDPTVASGGRVDARGLVRVTASIVDGKLLPVLGLRITGRVAGSRVGIGETAIGGLDGYYVGHLDRGVTPTATAHLNLSDIAQGGAPFGSASIDAVSHTDRSVDVAVHANPRPATAIDLDARVTPRGNTIAIALGHHHVVLPDGRELAGAGGSVTITPARVVAANIATTHRGGKVEVGASFDRETQALAAKLDIATIPVELIDPRAKGDASGHVTIDRTRGQWHGDARISAAGVVIDDRLSIDSTIHARVDGRRVSLEVGTTLDPTTAPSSDVFRLGALHGVAEVALAVDGPVDITNARGWMALTRRDVRAASITLKSIDLGMIGATGTVDGTVIITPTDTHGTIDIVGIKTPVGAISGTATFDNNKGEILASTKAMVEGVGAAQVDARVGLPDHLFDPAAWKLLGRDAVREVTAKLDQVIVDPKLLARFGITAPYHGRARVTATIGRGITSAHLQVDADALAGGAIVKPMDLHASAEMDANRSAVAVDLYVSGKLPRKDGDETGKLFHADAAIPVTFESWVANGYANARTAALKGTFTIPKTEVAAMLAIVGRKDVTKGTIDGAGKLAGTLAVPTALIEIAAHQVVVPPLVTGKLAPVLDELQISANWGGVGGSIEINGKESDGGRLKVTARGRPTDLAQAIGMVDVQSFDIAPLAAFAPGVLVSTSGKIAGHIDITGFDPMATRLDGKVVMINGRIPLSTMVGTMRDTNVALSVKARAATLDVSGKLGACNVGDEHRCRIATIHAEGTPDEITAKLTLDHIQPITATQPDISAVATTTLRREGDHWQGTTRVSRGVILIPRVAGSALLAQSAPIDMVFVDAVTPIQKPVRGAPEKPWVVTDVTIDSTSVQADELRGSVRGQIQVSLGDGAVGMLGVVEVEQGVADIFNHRYQVDHGNVTFDGTTDAQLDLRLVHDFAAVTLVADVGGRISNPGLVLSSEPGSYTEGQLLGFFLGGEPGGDPNSQTKDAGLGAGTSILSQKIGRAANKVLPVQIDVFNCAAATGTTSAACTVGKWISAKLFVAYKQHLEAKPDENALEGQVEYYLRHDILLEGNIGDRSYDGLDLLWRHRW